MCPKGVNEIANSVDSDQTAPLGAVWSGSALFAQTYLSENLGTIQYLLLLVGPKIKFYLFAIAYLPTLLPPTQLFFFLLFQN